MDQDHEEATRALATLTADSQFTFQTFDDDYKRKDKRLARIFHGTIEEHWAALCKMDNRGSGVFFTVNQTNLKGRTIPDMVAVRCVFIDLDGSPLDPVLAWKLKPHLIVETSPGKWHVYWNVVGLTFEQFVSLQKMLAELFHADPKIHDVTRVMRLPGFYHKKAEPFLIRIVESNPDLPPYQLEDFTDAGIEPESGGKDEPLPDYLKDYSGKTANEALADMQTWQEQLNSAALANLSKWVPAIWPKAKMTAQGGYRITSQMLKRDLEEDLSIDPKGIIDFGVSDQGDDREGKRTPVDIVVEHMDLEFKAAVHWLKEKLGIAVDVKDGGGVLTVDDFVAFREQHDFIFTPSGAHWPAASVNEELGKIPVGKKKIKASAWIAQHKPVHGLTWAPGHPQLILNRLAVDGGWVERDNVVCYNQYRPPTIMPGDPNKAGPWLDLLKKLYPNEMEHTHFMYWLAHRIQFPQIKINHAIVLGSGAQGIGKDTLLEAIKWGIGGWNFQEIQANNINETFNPFVRAVIARINEVHDLGDMTRQQFYNRMKIYLAAPPDMLRINEKNKRQYYVVNIIGIIMTTNYKTNGLYLPSEDRRHFFLWTDIVKEDFDVGFWPWMHNWYRKENGIWHTVAFLKSLDLSNWDPAAPPPRTAAFMEVVDANEPPENSELLDLIEAMGSPPVFTLQMLKNFIAVADNFHEENFKWLTDPKYSRSIPSKLERCGYSALRNPNGNNNGLWISQRQRQMMYVKRKSFGTDSEAYAAINKLIDQQLSSDPSTSKTKQ